jgi:hypothetical protein
MIPIAHPMSTRLGGGHVHIIRNKGTIVAQTIAVQLIPSGQPRKLDASDPGNCNFPN